MKRTMVMILVVVALVSLMVTPVFAAPAGKDIPANDKSNNLYLYPKVPTGDWPIIWEGAWGKLNLKNGSFNGHGLVAGESYTLVVADPWPSAVYIGSGMANDDGNIHLNANLSSIEAGDKIWLVTSSDTDGDVMTGWNPSSYLFEHNPIGP